MQNASFRRGLIVLFGAILVASLAKSQERLDEKKSQTNSRIYQQTFTNFPFNWPLSIIKPPTIYVVAFKETETNWSTPNCSYPNSHDEADLCEQRNMSTAADRTVYLGSWQLFISVLGFIALIYTLRLTFRATRAAENAAEISLEQSKIAKYAAEVPLRAFLVKQDVTIISNGTVKVHVINKGKTPANNISVEVVAYGINDEGVSVQRTGTLNEIKMQIMPSETEVFVNKIEDYSIFKSPKVVVKIKYNDWFGNNCLTTIEFQSCGSEIWGPISSKAE